MWVCGFCGFVVLGVEIGAKRRTAFSKPAVSHKVSWSVWLVHVRMTSGSSEESIISTKSLSSLDCRLRRLRRLRRYGVNARSVDLALVNVPVFCILGLIPMAKKMRTGVISLKAPSGVIGGGGGNGGPPRLARSVNRSW